MLQEVINSLNSVSNVVVVVVVVVVVCLCGPGMLGSPNGRFLSARMPPWLVTVLRTVLSRHSPNAATQPNTDGEGPNKHEA